MTAINIFGIGNVNVSPAEYTNPATASIYQSNMQGLYNIITTDPSSLTASQYDQLVGYITNLQALVSNTQLPNNQSSLLSFPMAQNLNDIFKSLQAAGINVSSPSTTIPDDQKLSLLQNWHDLGGFSIASVIQGAIQNVYTRSLQAMVELDYVKTGNDVIFNSLNNLETALNTTNNVLNTLTNLQNLANQLTVNSPNPFVFPPKSASQIPQGVLNLFPGVSASTIFQNTLNGINPNITGANAEANYVQSYKQFASAYFAQQFPAGPPNGQTLQNWAVSLLNNKAALLSQLNTLESISPSNNRNVPNTLAANIWQVVLNISATFTDANAVAQAYMNANSGHMPSLGAYVATGFVTYGTYLENATRTWMLDGQNLPVSNPNAISAGQIQNNLSQAIRAGQSLNDTQKQKVNQYMFLFQEFYKSANDVLNQISQIIEKMAQNIGR
jgi:hypothetical protein